MSSNLVPVGDHVALAQAIMFTLYAGHKAEDLKKRSVRFGIGSTIDQYLEVFFGKKGCVST